MPAKECENGKWKSGETGECKYETQEEAEKDNEDYNELEEMKLEKRHIISVTEDDDTYTIVYEKDKEDDDEEIVEIIDEEVEEDKERNKPLQKEVKDIWTKNITMEKRYFNTETRTEKRDDGTTTVTGHASVFNQLSDDLGGFREMIAPGAFSDVLDNDVRALVNHDPSKLLARTTSGTLKLEETETGLQYSFNVPSTTYGNDLVISMERGDLTSSSFAFTVQSDTWDINDDGDDIRTINKVKRLYDVSPVTYPAYPDADDLTLAKRSLALHKEKQENDKQEKDLVKRSLLRLKIELKKRK
jgi:HK97 family phage prohead protease